METKEDRILMIVREGKEEEIKRKSEDRWIDMRSTSIWTKKGVLFEHNEMTKRGMCQWLGYALFELGL